MTLQVHPASFDESPLSISSLVGLQVTLGVAYPAPPVFLLQLLQWQQLPLDPTIE